MAYRPPTIKEKGLRQHLADLGLDYDLFNERMSEGQKAPAIALALSKRAGKPVKPHTVRQWRKYWEETHADNS